MHNRNKRNKRRSERKGLSHRAQSFDLNLALSWHALPIKSRTHDLRTQRAPQPTLATLAFIWGLGVRLFFGSACLGHPGASVSPDTSNAQGPSILRATGSDCAVGLKIAVCGYMGDSLIGSSASSRPCSVLADVGPPYSAVMRLDRAPFACHQAPRYHQVIRSRGVTATSERLMDADWNLGYRGLFRDCSGTLVSSPCEVIPGLASHVPGK